MTTYGITSTGFVQKHLTDCIEDMEAMVRSSFGLPSDYVFQSGDVFEKLIKVVSQSHADLWELAAAVWNAFDPSGAEGISFDNCLDMVGLRRNPATRSQVTNIWTGVTATEVLKGSLVATTTGTLDQFRTKADAVLSLTECVYAAITVTAPTNGKIYTVTINSIPVTTTAGPSSTTYTILEALCWAINSAPTVAAAGIFAAQNSTTEIGLYVVTGTDPIILDPDPDVFTLAVNASLTLGDIGNLIDMESVNSGPIPAYATELSEIVNQIAGITSTSNTSSAILGTYLEKDSAGRVRREQSVAIPGAGTVEACRAKLLAIANVTNAKVLENITDATDTNGLLPHSIHAVVAGGIDAAIADVLWTGGKGEGIATNGTTSVAIVDSMGYTQTMKFSRPIEKKMWVRMTYTRDLEATVQFPQTGAADMKNAALACGATIIEGRDALPLLFAGPLTLAVPGLKTLLVELALDNGGGSPGAYQSTPYVIAFNEYATFDVGRMTVVAG